MAIAAQGNLYYPDNINRMVDKNSQTYEGSDGYSIRFNEYSSIVPTGTTLESLLYQCHEARLNPKIEIPSDDLYANLLLEILDALYEPTRYQEDSEGEGKLTNGNPLLEPYSQEHDGGYLDLFETILQEYEDLEFVRNLRLGIAELINYCTNYPTNKTSENLLTLIQRKELYNSDMLPIDYLELLSLGFKEMSKRMQIVATPLFKIISDGKGNINTGFRTIDKPYNPGGNQVALLSYFDIQNIFSEMSKITSSFEDAKKRRERINKILIALMLISIALTGCSGGENGSPTQIADDNQQSGSDDDIVKITKTITPSPTATQTITASPIPTNTVTLTPTSTSTPTLPYCSTEGLSSPIFDKNGNLLYFDNFVVAREEDRQIHVVNAQFGDNQVLLRYLKELFVSDSPNFCPFQQLDKPLLVIQPFYSGTLKVNATFIQGLEKAGISMFITLQKPVDHPELGMIPSIAINIPEDSRDNYYEVFGKPKNADRIRSITPGTEITIPLTISQTIHIWPNNKETIKLGELFKIFPGVFTSNLYVFEVKN